MLQKQKLNIKINNHIPIEVIVNEKNLKNKKKEVKVNERNLKNKKK